jgi:hypothetical protein
MKNVETNCICDIGKSTFGINFWSNYNYFTWYATPTTTTTVTTIIKLFYKFVVVLMHILRSCWNSYAFVLSKPSSQFSLYPLYESTNFYNERCLPGWCFLLSSFCITNDVVWHATLNVELLFWGSQKNVFQIDGNLLLINFQEAKKKFYNEIGERARCQCRSWENEINLIYSKKWFVEVWSNFPSLLLRWVPNT